MAKFSQTSKRNCLISVFVVGGVCCLLAAILIPVVKNIIHQKIGKKVAIKNGTQAYDAWVEPIVPVYMYIYLFNVSNPGQVLAGDKPVVTEVGPLVYREIRKRENIEFGDNGTTVNYSLPKFYVFEPNMSALDENENLTLPNIPMLSLAAIYAPNKHPFVSPLLKDVLKMLKVKVFYRKTAKEFLWGYKVSWLSELHKIIKKIPSTFGMFTGKHANGTNDGLYKIHTGQDSFAKSNIIISWNGKTELAVWKKGNDSYCAMLNGTDGQSWPPFVAKNARLYVYSSDVCRSVYLEYEKTVTTKGIEMYRFTAPASVMANASANPDNECFCGPLGCLDGGVQDVSPCNLGAPVVISQPHFYLASPHYQEGVDGLQPRKELHESQIDVEPITGAVLAAAKRLQTNFMLQPFRSFSATSNITPVLLPVFWVEERGIISDDLAAKFVGAVYVPLRVAHGLEYTLLAVGLLLLIVGAVALILLKRRPGDGDDPLLVDHDKDDGAEPSGADDVAVIS